MRNAKASTKSKDSLSVLGVAGTVFLRFRYWEWYFYGTMAWDA